MEYVPCRMSVIIECDDKNGVRVPCHRSVVIECEDKDGVLTMPHECDHRV